MIEVPSDAVLSAAGATTGHSLSPLSPAIHYHDHQDAPVPDDWALGETADCAHEELMLNWDDEQREVIEADFDARILVEAGPGTGKTAVACARVACLINLWEVQPANVLLLSFTRTAVAELRDRIAQYVGDEHLAASVRISTLDSAAWHLIYGFDRDAGKVFGGYEVNIETLLQRLRSGDADLLDHLDRYQHVVVDEAQDLTSTRAKLVIELIKVLNPDCGITIFADPHQAIYGFTADADDGDGKGDVTLLDLLREEGALNFRGLGLKTLYRTNETGLSDLMGSLREVLSSNGVAPDDQHATMKTQLRRLAGPIDKTRTDLPNHAKGRSDLLILYRRRAEVLSTSAFFCSEGITHRLRLSGLPVCIQPWIGRMFFDCRDAEVSFEQFCDNWEQRSPTEDSDLTPDAAWRSILRFARRDEGKVDVRRLRQVLSRSRPPVELCVQDCAREGPILGTIHASKGREADTVYLYVSSDTPKDAVEEESRVVYVGATRARKELCVSAPGRIFAKTLNGSRRVYSIRKDKRSAQVELGRDGDLNVAATVSKNLHPSQDDALAVQERLAAVSDTITSVTAHSHPDWDYRYRLRFAEGVGGPWIGELSDEVNRDLFSIIKLTGNFLRPPGTIRHLFSVSVRTAVLNQDHPGLAELHFPFRISGIFLVPVIRAWTVVYFANRQKMRGTP